MSDCACCACPDLALPALALLVLRNTPRTCHTQYIMYDVRPLIPTQLVDQPLARSFPLTVQCRPFVSSRLPPILSVYSRSNPLVRCLSPFLHLLYYPCRALRSTKQGQPTPRPCASRLLKTKGRTISCPRLSISKSLDSSDSSDSSTSSSSSIPRPLDLSTPRFIISTYLDTQKKTT